MRNFTVLLVMLTAACGDTNTDIDAQGLEGWDYPAWGSYTDLVLPHSNFRADIDFTLEPEWAPADVQEGQYRVTLVEAYSSTCSFGQPGESMVQASDSPDGVLLWGYAPILTDGEALSAVGQSFSASLEEGVDCTVVDTRNGMGAVGSPTAFTLDVVRIVHTVGADCPADFEYSSCALEYRANFNWIDEEPVE